MANYGGALDHLSDDHIQEVVARIGTKLGAAAELGVTRNALDWRLKKMGWKAPAPGKPVEPPPRLEIHAPPEAEIPDEELWQQRVRKFHHTRAHFEARKLIQCRVRMNGPIGITFLGDPHVDDDGTDLPDLERHIRTIRATEGLFAANVGDTTNNWVGRLARLYAQQSTSRSDALQLARHFLNELRGEWLFIVGGNHDAWSGEGMDDPMSWLSGQVNALYQSSEVRLQLNFPESKEKVTVNCRHDFSGHSQWNPAHGVMKAQQLGTMDDIAVCGHKHVSGHMELKDPRTERICHAVQVASFKLFDRYAMEKGFRDQNISPSATMTIDPHETRHNSRIHMFWDVEQGADYLNYLRKKWQRKK